MNFADLKSEVARRGFDYLSDDALGRYVNDGYLIDICEERDWLWLRGRVIENGSIDVPDLRSVLYVLNLASQTKLAPLQESAITDSYGTDLATPGDPLFYYFSGPTTIVPYPLSEAQIEVVYTRTPPVLSGNDEPLLPARFHTLICDAAVARAYEDDDEWDAAGVATERFQQRLQVAVQTDASPQHDRPDDFIVQTGDM